MKRHDIFPDIRPPSIWSLLKSALMPRELECLQVEVTSHCTGRCVYCPHTTRSNVWRSRHMPPETFAALWPLMLKTSRVHLQGWGEPFLNPHFMDFADLAIRGGCKVSTTTCGMLMDEHLAEDIVGSGIDVVAFSLVGTDEATNAARERIPFGKVESSFKLLQRIRRERQGVHLELHIAYLMLASNIEAIRGLPDLMNDWGAHCAVISTMDYIPSNNMRNEAFLPHEREKIAKAQAVLDEVGAKIRADGHDFHASLPAPSPAPQCREHAHATLYVDADGHVSPCVYLNVPTDGQDPSRLVFGDVSMESPLDIWNKTEYLNFREWLTTSDPPDVCRVCPKRFEKSLA